MGNMVILEGAGNATRRHGKSLNWYQIKVGAAACVAGTLERTAGLLGYDCTHRYLPGPI